MASTPKEEHISHPCDKCQPVQLPKPVPKDTRQPEAPKTETASTIARLEKLSKTQRKKQMKKSKAEAASITSLTSINPQDTKAPPSTTPQTTKYSVAKEELASSVHSSTSDPDWDCISRTSAISMDDWVEVSEDPDHELDEDKLLLVKKRGGV